jgi:hypothetical protein
MPVNEEEIAEGVVVTEQDGASDLDKEKIDELGDVLSSRFQVWHDERCNVETKWISNMRAYYRQHSASVLATIKEGRSKTFLGITKLKTNAGYGRLLTAFGDPKHWSVTPTPVPDLNRANAINEDINSQMDDLIKEVELPDDPTERVGAILSLRKNLIDSNNNERKQVAEETSKKMNALIADQLVEANYPTALRRALFQACMIGAGAIKAGTVKVVPKVTFSKDGQGSTTIEFEESITPGIERVSVFDLVPDPDAIEVENMTGIFQRHALTRSDLVRLKKFPGFNAEAIDLILTQNPNGKYTPLQYELDLESVGDQKVRTDVRNRYELLEYWGDIQDYDILQVLDPDSVPEGKKFEDFNQINVWVVNGVTIKVGYINSVTNRLPFFIFPYDSSLDQFWGTGIAEAMSGSQKDINTAARYLLDCAEFNHIPNLEVNTSMLKAGHKTAISPGKIWHRTRGDLAFDAVKALKFPNIVPELLNIISLYRGIVDEETNLPALISGQNAPGQASLGRTASGISMVLSTANVVGQSPVKNVDDNLIRPMIRELYFFNMRWSDDESVKGDMKVNAKGTSTLQAKEVELAQLTNFANITQNDQDNLLTNRDELLKEMAERLNLDADRFVKTADEVQALIEQQKNDPETRQRISLELQKLQAEVDAQIANAEKDRAGVKNDEELLSLKKAELSGKLLVDANDIENGRQTGGDVDKKDIRSLESVNQNDGIKSNNET